jgi:anti-sigma regulatory factor (Ser/Thr protein kinase)
MPRVAEMARTIWAQTTPQLVRLPAAADQFAESRAEHRELLEALRVGAPRRARSAAERHARLAAARFAVSLGPREDDKLVHRALLYDRDDAFLASTVPLIQDGLEAGEQVLVVTTSRNTELLVRALGRPADGIEFRDANDWYLLPSHTLLSYERYVEQATSRRVRIVGEVAWNGESRIPMTEWIRYEAALNVAFAVQPLTIVCPYDMRELPQEILAEARRTHPELCNGDGTRRSPEFTEAGQLARELDRETFAAPAAPTGELPIRGNLPEVRDFVLKQARRAGLSGKSVQDIFLAVQEIAGAVITHGGDHGGIRAWIAEGALVFEIRDDATGVGDPLFGQLASDPAMLLEPRGLWLARLLCDLVEVRSGARGLVMRLHIALR